ncbi:HAD family hydrolase [bacterium]|nr:HAD family hydrolase [bacterium]
MIQAVIFDLDGTLADTIGDIGAAVNSLLAERGYAQHDLDVYKLMVGNGFANLMRRALPDEVVADEILFSSLASEAAARYAARALATTKPFEGVVDLLEALSTRGIPCAVLSNKPDPMAKTMIALLFPAAKFLAVLGDRPGVPRKPDPSEALAIAASSGIPAERWAFVGDSGVDMATGSSAGMTPLGVSWGYRSVGELLESGASAILRTPADLLCYL